MIKQLPYRNKLRSLSGEAEDGYILVAVIFMMAILVLSLSVALPRLRQDIQRDRELETLHRGKQYIRAIQLYYRKFHRYPPTAEALENTDGMRFLRKRYIDPITGKDDWQPIQFGQNKVPRMGLFGVPLAPTQISGTGTGNNGTTSATNGSSAFSIANPAGGDSASTQSSADGQAFGGAVIIGFSSPSDKASILHYKLQHHYSLWEFVYDPTQDGTTVPTPGQGSGTNTASAAGTTSSTTGTTSSTGSSSQGSNPNPTPPNPVNGQPQCGGKWGPNGNLPIPCPQ